jgi:hypothetical protein
MNCLFCFRVIQNKGSLVAHQKVCKENPNRISFKRSPNAGRKKGSVAWNKGLKGIQTAWNKGLTGIPGHKHTEETKKQMSESRKMLYASGWEPTCGRAKKYDYESPIAGKIKVDGTWELAVAKFLDSLGIEWRRNKKRFEYVNLKGSISTYQPDFVIEGKYYIEVKGYETDLDRCKWSQFPEPLVIFRKAQIEEINGMSAEKVGCTGLLNQLRGNSNIRSNRIHSA